jgi:hypothetical protein
MKETFLMLGRRTMSITGMIEDLIEKKALNEDFMQKREIYLSGMLILYMEDHRSLTRTRR